MEEIFIRKVVRFIVLLPFRILSLPVMAALFAAEWIGIFLVSMSAWIFNLVATFIFIIGIVTLIMGGASGRHCLGMMGLSFGFFIVPSIGEAIVLFMLKVRYGIIDLLW